MIDLYDGQDRYRAAGMAYPSCKTACTYCEGMGFTPTMESTHICEECGGTGDLRAEPEIFEDSGFW